jgi:hypothetical protein
MTTETKRDLLADMALCAAASGGFYISTSAFEGPHGMYAETAVLTEEGEQITKSDTEFIIEAREGWPHAIRRALAAEAEVGRLRERKDELETLTRRLGNVLERAKYYVERDAVIPASQTIDDGLQEVLVHE